ncbi:MAG: ATP-binding protein [Planctomycetota bacterium]
MIDLAETSREDHAGCEALDSKPNYDLLVVGSNVADPVALAPELHAKHPRASLLFCHDVLARERVPDLGVPTDRWLALPSACEAADLRRFAAVLLARPRSEAETEARIGSLQRSLKRAEELVAEARQAKSEFMANMSHELRTPMNAILGFTRLLMKEPLTDGQFEKLRQVHDAGESLLGLMNDMLDFSKLATGQLRLSHTVFDVDAVIREVLEATRPQACLKGLPLRYRVVDQVPQWLEGDKGRVRQILVNLVQNAVKFTEQGGVHVHAALDEETADNATLRIVVTDTGVGIAPERQPVIFQSFTQADGSSTRRHGGMGLGLAICRQLVDLMGGQIGFRSDPGQGATFWISATFRKCAPSECPPAGREGEVLPESRCRLAGSCDGYAAPGSRPQRALVAEADHVTRTMAEMLLARCGCLVELAAEAGEAMQVLRTTPYDLVLLQSDLPGLDLDAALAAVRRHEARSGQQTSVVLLTPTAPDESIRPFLSQVEGRLRKPLDAERFLAALHEHVERRSAHTSQQNSAEDPESYTDYVAMLAGALTHGDFPEMERRAGRLRHFAQQAGHKTLADAAMRVQLTARGQDHSQCAASLLRLEQALREHAATHTACA